MDEYEEFFWRILMNERDYFVGHYVDENICPKCKKPTLETQNIYSDDWCKCSWCGFQSKY